MSYQSYTGPGCPDFTAWANNAWGSGYGLDACGCGFFLSGMNLVFGQNPPYYLDNFLAVYPKFFGQATPVVGCTTVNGSPTVAVPTTSGLLMGQFLQASGLPPGSVIIAVGSNQVTLNQNATASASGVTLFAYETPPIPVAVTQMYVNLAVASLIQARWQDAWAIAISWFVAHYLTLFASTDAAEVMTMLVTTYGEVPSGAVPGTVYTLSTVPPGGALQSLTVNGVFQIPGGVDYTLSGLTITFTAPTPSGAQLWATWPIQTPSTAVSTAQIAAQGLAGGIQTAKSVGDVSVSYQVLTSLEEWGAWNLTKYGQLLATMAKTIGAGPMVIY